MNKKLKIIIGIIVLVIIVVVVMSFLGSKKTGTPSQSGSPLSSTTGVVPLPGANTVTGSDEFSTLLSSINGITIDTSIFQNPAYKMLRDAPVSLGTDVVGRINPFAPVGNDLSIAPTADVVVQPVQTGKITKSTAEFGAQVTVNDTVPTSVVFEYGTSDVFGSATTPVTVTKSGTVLVTVTKLLPETTYYVRPVVVRGNATTLGDTTNFTTPKK